MKVVGVINVKIYGLLIILLIFIQNVKNTPALTNPFYPKFAANVKIWISLFNFVCNYHHREISFIQIRLNISDNIIILSAEKNAGGFFLPYPD